MGIGAALCKLRFAEESPRTFLVLFFKDNVKRVSITQRQPLDFTVIKHIVIVSAPFIIQSIVGLRVFVLLFGLD